jgi:hypothetical protein
VDPYPDKNSEYGSGSKRAKMTHKMGKNLIRIKMNTGTDPDYWYKIKFTDTVCVRYIFYTGILAVSPEIYSGPE